MSEQAAPHIPEDLKDAYNLASYDGEPAFWGSDVREYIERAGRAEFRNAVLELEIRYLMWSSHGHLGRYGDDGEMQCGECAPFGVADYKRDPIDKVREAFMWAKLSCATLAVPSEGSR